MNERTRKAIVWTAGAAALVAGTECAIDYGENKTQQSVIERRSDVEFYEDGSGHQLVNGQIVKTFDEDTFVWDCASHGNRICGGITPTTTEGGR